MREDWNEEFRDMLAGKYLTAQCPPAPTPGSSLADLHADDLQRMAAHVEAKRGGLPYDMSDPMQGEGEKVVRVQLRKATDYGPPPPVLWIVAFLMILFLCGLCVLFVVTP